MDQSKQRSPQLYLVATPIGHLKDMSYRAVQTLKEVDIIFCEDTRTTSHLLKTYQISTPLKTYHEHNAEMVRPAILEAMHQGKTIALVSDAGTPLISDPGYKLVQEAYQHHFTVSVIPGPCALIAALTLSGLPTDTFKFCGFLPPKSMARRSALKDEAMQSATLIYYESPQRLLETLKDIQDTLGNREIAVIRELTKIFEEVKRGTCLELIEWYQNHPPKGEIVICIAGHRDEPLLTDAWKQIIEALTHTHKAKEIATLLCNISPCSKSQIYDYVLACKKNQL